MIGWLFDWWNQNQANRRGIFAYRCGQTARMADPLVIANELDMADPEWESQIVVLAQPIPSGQLDPKMQAIAEDGKKAATARVVKAARAAFKLPPLADDGTGATDLEVIEIISAFVVFLGGLAVAAAPFAGRSAPTRPDG